jgi:hypothetical protein
MQTIKWFGKLVIIFSLFLLTVSCQNADALPPASSPIPLTDTPSIPAATATIPPTPTPDPTYEAAVASWLISDHAHTYALEKGPNTYCARCHSPANWDPAAVIDPPPNCVSCKFAFESEARVAEGNPLIPEEEWVNIDCTVCHLVEDDSVDPQVTWLNPVTGYHETITNSTALCEKCHRDTESGLTHTRELGNGAHADFVCTDCHDPHSTKASCTQAGCHHVTVTNNSECDQCHPDALGSHTMEQLHSGGHDCMGCHGDLVGLPMDGTKTLAHEPIHQSKVLCTACHDASGLEVKPLEQDGVWVTWRTTEGPLGETTEVYQSHTLQREVDCTRCHYAENPWGLVSLEATEVP